jgi:hypothetical protein
MNPPPTRPEIIKASLIQAATNTVINAAINYFMVRGKDVHYITADSITASGSDTVIGHSVFLAVSLAVIFTLLGFKSLRPVLPNVTWGQVIPTAVKNGIYAFGLVIIFGVLWQRVFPDLTIGTVGAALIAGGIAGVASGVTNYTTVTRLLERFQ